MLGNLSHTVKVEIVNVSRSPGKETPPTIANLVNSSNGGYKMQGKTGDEIDIKTAQVRRTVIVVASLTSSSRVARTCLRRNVGRDCGRFQRLPSANKYIYNRDRDRLDPHIVHSPQFRAGAANPQVAR